MAVWQVEFALVPRRALTATHGVPLRALFDADWWAGAALPAGYGDRLTAVAPSSAASGAPLGAASSAPSGAASGAERQTWGSPDGNRIDVMFEGGRPARLVAAVDVRKLDAKFGAMLLQFARTADALLVRRDGLVIEPLVGAFGAALRSADAWQFANDPAAFVAKIRAEEGGAADED